MASLAWPVLAAYGQGKSGIFCQVRTYAEALNPQQTEWPPAPGMMTRPSLHCAPTLLPSHQENHQENKNDDSCLQRPRFFSLPSVSTTPLVVFNNTNDYNSNLTYVRHVLLPMDTPPIPGNHGMWRSIHCAYRSLCSPLHPSSAGRL